MIDPGPRSLIQAKERETFFREDKERIEKDYPHFSFPTYAGKGPTQGYRIDVLGEMRTNSQGNLLVLGGYGRAGGNQAIGGFGGADSWYDDIADGPVTCELTLDGQNEPVVLHAWVIVGSPKVAPELVNIVTLDDVLYDVGVRFHGLDPDIYDAEAYRANGGWNPHHCADFLQDIEPIIKRPAGYQWVANIQGMMPLTSPPFDPRAKDQPGSTELYQKRQTYLSYFRPTDLHADFPHATNQLFKSQVSQAQVMLESAQPLLNQQKREANTPLALAKLQVAHRLESVWLQLNTTAPQLTATKEMLEALPDPQKLAEVLQHIDAALAALGANQSETASRLVGISRKRGTGVQHEQTQGAKTSIQLAQDRIQQAIVALEKTPPDTQQASSQIEQALPALKEAQSYLLCARTNIQNAQMALERGIRQATAPSLREVLTRAHLELGHVLSLLIQEQGVPLVPLQAGTNPVRNNDGPIDKFFTLTPTQYFLLQQ